MQTYGNILNLPNLLCTSLGLWSEISFLVALPFCPQELIWTQVVLVKRATCMRVSNEQVHCNLKTFCMIGPVSNMFYLVLSWLMGRRPEFTDPKVVAQGEGREGKLSFNLWLKMKPCSRCWPSLIIASLQRLFFCKQV